MLGIVLATTLFLAYHITNALRVRSAMKREKAIVLIVILLVAVQVPYIWMLWLQPKPEPPKPAPLIYLKPNLERSADINWFNPEPVRMRWFWFDNASNSGSGEPSPTVLRSGDNLTLWIRASHFNRTEFNLTRITNIQIWLFNMWSPNASQFGGIWKLHIYLQGVYDRTQMLAVPNEGSGTQVIFNWDDDRIAKPGELLRFDINFESIVPVDAVLVIRSTEILVVGQSKEVCRAIGS